MCDSILAVREERRKKTASKNVIYHVRVRTPQQPIVMVFGACQDLAEVINRAKFCIDRFKGFGLGKAIRLMVSHYSKPQWPLSLCFALSCTHLIMALAASLQM